MKLYKIISKIESKDSKLVYKQILFYSKYCELDTVYKTKNNKVHGCQSNTYIISNQVDGLYFFNGDSEGLISKGLLGLIIHSINGLTKEEIQSIDFTFLTRLSSSINLSMSRSNGLYNMVNKIISIL